MALINTTTTGVLGTTLFGDGSGDLTVQKDGVTINKVTKQPMFSVYKGSGQTVSSGVFTKITFDQVDYNFEGGYSTSTNRFTPNVAGYYQINALTYLQAATYTNRLLTVIKRNDSLEYKFGTDQIVPNSTATEARSLVSSLIYLNGTTDYLEIYALTTGSGTLTIQSGIPNTWWTGYLVRAA
jgi:hypothetical protein